jgi:hypothetical protein
MKQASKKARSTSQNKQIAYKWEGEDSFFMEFKDNGELLKDEAICIANFYLANHSLALNESNTEFSNTIAPEFILWWSNFSNDKLTKDFHLLLHDKNKKVLYYFFIKKDSIKEPEKLFRQRNDNSKTNNSEFKFNVGDKKFINISVPEKVQFKKYLKCIIKYKEGLFLRRKTGK